MAYTFEPSGLNSAFNPDQLIAGSAQIVTDTVTLASGLNLTRGALIGMQTANEFTLAATASTTSGGANAGAETIGTLSSGAFVRIGTYRVNLTSTTAFNVLDPTGETVGTGTVGTAFTSNQIGFTVTTGAGIASGDGFAVAVEEIAGSGSDRYVQATATATDGSQDPKNWAILAEDTNTSSTGTNAATSCPVYLAGEFDPNYMTFGTGLSPAGVKLALQQSTGRLFLKTGALGNVIV